MYTRERKVAVCWIMSPLKFMLSHLSNNIPLPSTKSDFHSHSLYARFSTCKSLQSTVISSLLIHVPPIFTSYQLWSINLATSHLHPPFLLSISLNCTRPANSCTIPYNCLLCLHTWMAQERWKWLREQCSPASVGASAQLSNSWPNPFTNNPNFPGFKLSSSSLRLSCLLSFSNNQFDLRKIRGLNKCTNVLLHLCI